MKRNLTEIIFFLDRSGSMGRLETDTINECFKMATRLVYTKLRWRLRALSWKLMIPVFYEPFQIKNFLGC